MSGLASLAALMDKVFAQHKRKGLPQEIKLIRSVLSQIEDCPEAFSKQAIYQQIQVIAKNAHYDKSVLKNDVMTPFFYYLLANSTLRELHRLLDSKLFERCLLNISKNLYAKQRNLNYLEETMQELFIVDEYAFLKLRELCYVAQLPVNSSTLSVTCNTFLQSA